MLAVPDHVQDPEYWDWTQKDLANRFTSENLDYDESYRLINDYSIDTERLLTVSAQIDHTATQLEEIHANDWHKHEGGCACLE